MFQIPTLCECKCNIDHSVLPLKTHTLTKHTEIKNHLTRKYEKLATRIVQLAKYELNWTRKLKPATHIFQLATCNSNSQLELATRTRNSNSQLASCNSQLAEYLDPIVCMLNLTLQRQFSYKEVRIFLSESFCKNRFHCHGSKNRVTIWRVAPPLSNCDI